MRTLFFLLPASVALAIALAGFSLSGVAQDQPAAAPPADAASEATAAGPAAAEYERLLEEWKTVLKELRRLKVEYQSSTPEQQPQIVEQWDALVAKGNETVAVLTVAAVRAFEEAPNDDPQLARFLVKLAEDAIARDDYATAKQVGDAMIAGQSTERQIYNAAAIASFVLNDYERADEFFKTATDSGVLSEYGQELTPYVAEYKALWAKEQEIRAAEAEADDLPRVKLKTTKGDVVIELFENEAPDTVGNFVSLVEQGFYDGLSFHRVIANFMAQGGDPKGDGTGGPGYNIFCECYKPEARMHFQGSLSMAHAGRDTGGSQFFLTFRQTPHLNGRHTCFGRVIEGMEVLSQLQRIDPENPGELVPDKIVKAEVLRKRDHVYAPRKVE
jgi:cyclophilin family peptidyl-prolyl cis-trans isomerase